MTIYNSITNATLNSFFGFFEGRSTVVHPALRGPSNSTVHHLIMVAFTEGTGLTVSKPRPHQEATRHYKQKEDHV